MIGNIGPLEIGIVLVVALLVFGPKRLPELGNGLGKGLREFKESVTGDGEGTTLTPGASTTSSSASSATPPGPEGERGRSSD